jgi:cytochrome b561
MSVWEIVAIIVVVWLLAVLVIIAFMMGAARGRAKEAQARTRDLQDAHPQRRGRSL